MAEVAELVADGDPDGEEASEDSDDGEDDVADDAVAPPSEYMRKSRNSVSAEAYGAWNQFGLFEPPVFPKTEEQRASLESILRMSILFRELDRQALDVIIGAMQQVVAYVDQRIIQEGQDGEHLFVVASGTLDCLKVIDGQEICVRVYQAGECFGELALLYNTPRAASIQAREESYLWMLDRGTFNYIVKDAAMKRREQNETILRSIPLLQSMQDNELAQLADALRREVYAASINVIDYQDAQDTRFFLVEAGELVAWKPIDGEWQEMMRYSAGHYFGELALLDDQVRQATVVTQTECILLVVDRHTFKRLLGPLEERLRRQAAANYVGYTSAVG